LEAAMPQSVTPKIFGREPALWIAAVQAVLMLLATLGIPGVDGGLAAAVALLLTAVCTAWMALAVRPVAPAVFVGVVTALVPLLARFGLDLSDVQVGTIGMVVIAVVTLLARGQVSPAVEPAAYAMRAIGRPPA
jgi:hypothetical protein